MEPSPFLPQTTIAIEKVKIAANEAHPNVKIMTEFNFLNYNLFKRDEVCNSMINNFNLKKAKI
tara:strand:- start:1011 stop:1199 length:189 start_codon:yes stop_codon:yes gene_type:complete